MPKLYVVRNTYEGPERSVTLATDNTVAAFEQKFGKENVDTIRVNTGTYPHYLGRFMDSYRDLRWVYEAPIKNGDVVFFTSTEFLWGLPGLIKTWAMQGKRVRTCGVWRNTVRLPGDYIGPDTYYVEKEDEIVSNLDVNFFSSSHVMNCMGYEPDHNLVVTGLSTKTYDPKWRNYCGNEPRWDVVFPHRQDYSKNVDFFYKVAELLSGISSQKIRVKMIGPQPNNRQAPFQAGITYFQCHSRSEYFAHLADSDIVFSCSTLESYGYAMVEGVKFGCVPVAPDFATYPELFPENCLYPYSWIEEGRVKDVAGLIRDILRNIQVYRDDIKDLEMLGDNADEVMAFHIGQLMSRDGIVNLNSATR